MLRLARAQIADQLQAVGDDDGTELFIEPDEGFGVVADRLDVQHFLGDVSLELALQAGVGNRKQPARSGQDSQHDGDGGRRVVLNGGRLLRPTFEHSLDDGGLSPRAHESTFCETQVSDERRPLLSPQCTVPKTLNLQFEVIGYLRSCCGLCAVQKRPGTEAAGGFCATGRTVISSMAGGGSVSRTTTRPAGPTTPLPGRSAAG